MIAINDETGDPFPAPLEVKRIQDEAKERQRQKQTRNKT